MSGSNPKRNIPYGGEVPGRRLGDTNTQRRRDDSSMASDDDSLESKLIVQNKKLLQTVKELESVLSQRKNEERRIEQLENENEYLKMQLHLKEAEERIANERKPEAGNNQMKDEKTIKSLKEDKKRLEDRVKILCLEFDFKSVPPEVINQHMKDLYEETIETLKEENEAMKKNLKEAEERIANERQSEAGNNRITGLRKDLAKKEEEIAKLNKYLSDKESAGLKDELANKEDDIAKLNKYLTDVRSDLEKKENEVEKLGGDLSRAIRLCKVMGIDITDNNPDIAELGDPNRPTKLAERYSQLYDNEWTDAYEEIERNGVKEVDVIKRLLDSLKDVYKFCNQVSVNWTKNIEASALLIPGTDNGRPNTENLPATSRKQITDFRKAFAPSLSGDVFKQYLKATKQSLDKYPETKRYIKACVDICWLMSIQDPPVVLDLEEPRGPFDGDKYKTYWKTGKMLDFVVWPPMRLHDGGALLSRGVAQRK